jgi:hypothetical protein
VQSGSTQFGQVFYRLTGDPVSDKQLGEVVDANLADTFDETLADLYAEQRAASRQQLLTADAGGEIGAIPIHAGTLRSHRDYDDLSGISPLFLPSPAMEPATFAGSTPQTTPGMLLARV